MVTKGVKAICIAPMDSEALLPCLAEAQEAGVVVVNLDNRLNADTADQLGMDPIPFVGVSDEDSAYLAAKAICEAMAARAKSRLSRASRARTTPAAQSRRGARVQRISRYHDRCIPDGELERGRRPLGLYEHPAGQPEHQGRVLRERRDVLRRHSGD
jgi:ribose transport system substrate-binding protein